jgi:hypothetical protein
MRVKTKVSALVFVVAMAVLQLSGCGDMPVIDPDAKVTPPAIILGPYLTDADADSVVMRFQTDRRCVAGLRLVHSDSRRIERFATFDTMHALPVRNLNASQATECRILLDNHVGPVVPLKALPPSTGSVSLAFVGGNSTPEQFRQISQALSTTYLNAVVFTENPFARKPDLVSLRENFFAPLGTLAQRAPFLFPIGTRDDIPEKLYPNLKKDAVIWSRTFGCVHLVSFDLRVLQSPRRGAGVLQWLREDLKAHRDAYPWTVLVLSRPLVDAASVDARSLDALGDILEEGGVDLVVCGGSPGYHRTLPLRDSRGEAIRYVSCGGGVPSAAAPNNYTAAIYPPPHACVIRADEGHIELFALSAIGQVVDKFSYYVGQPVEAGEACLDKDVILDNARDVQRLRDEVLAIARQACRAVPDPNLASRIPVRLVNPSRRPFTGFLRWDMPADSSWKIEPPTLSYDLAPGQEKLAYFDCIPLGRQGALPSLIVDAGIIGYARQELQLTRLRKALLPFVTEQVTIDGYLTEPFWKNAVLLEDFGQLLTGEKPARVIRCVAAYNREGLLVAIRCEAPEPRIFPVKISHHDGSVHQDESVEIFIDPYARAREFFQFSTNLKGTALDRSSRLGVGWDPQWQRAVQFADKYYDVEILIPYAAVGLQGMPRPGSAWGLNVTRNDYVDTLPKKKKERWRRKEKEEPLPPVGACTVLQWAQTGGSNARCGNYGVVFFAKPE